MSFYSWIVDSLRNRRFSLNPFAKTYTFGGIYQGVYKNWKTDPTPIAWIQYSNAKYTHAINLNYLDMYEKVWFANLIQTLKKNGDIVDGMSLYKFIKQQKPSIIKKAYRVYFTSLCDFKLVSAGITALEKFVYPTSNQFVTVLNKTITNLKAQTPLNIQPIQYSSNEMRDRIIEAKYAIPIIEKKVPYNKALWKK